MGGRPLEVRSFCDWFRVQPARHRVLIAGNHDWLFEKAPAHAKECVGEGITYLEDSGATIDGLKFWGSPVQPWFLDWAFNRQRGADIRRHWDKIPLDTDVLVTHGPPEGVLDQSWPGQSDHLGCEELCDAVQRVQPLLHVFGHIHGSGGRIQFDTVRSVNASVLDEGYRVAHEPVIIEL